jgi:hypothetical protein
MTTTEHLQKIKAKCEALLALAEKRTPGRWNSIYCNVHCARNIDASTASCFPVDGIIFDDEAEDNATFIAACAGTAEAGWKSTISAIDSAIEMLSLFSNPHAYSHRLASNMAEAIIAAWPEELL